MRKNGEPILIIDIIVVRGVYKQSGKIIVFISPLDMSIICVLCVAHLPVEKDIRTIFNFRHAYSKLRNT